MIFSWIIIAFNIFLDFFQIGYTDESMVSQTEFGERVKRERSAAYAKSATAHATVSG